MDVHDAYSANVLYSAKSDPNFKRYLLHSNLIKSFSETIELFFIGFKEMLLDYFSQNHREKSENSLQSFGNLAGKPSKWPTVHIIFVLLYNVNIVHV